MTVRTLLLALCLILCSELAAVSKGSAVNKNDPWDPHHIDDLPAEIRQYVAGICKGPPSAQHDFATYSPHEKRWRINLEYLRCDGLGEYAGILVVAPYNLQVNLLRQLLPEGAQVGTVDKFQGQEAAIVIISMTTSKGTEAPRGTEFLFNPNRFNVAVSRAECLAIVVHGTELLEGAWTKIGDLRRLNLFAHAEAIAHQAR